MCILGACSFTYSLINCNIAFTATCSSDEALARFLSKSNRSVNCGGVIFQSWYEFSIPFGNITVASIARSMSPLVGVFPTEPTGIKSLGLILAFGNTCFNSKKYLCKVGCMFSRSIRSVLPPKTLPPS